METIQDVRSKLAEEMLHFQPIADLMPGGYRLEVALLDGKGKKIRKDAAANYWNPISGEISITFVKREDSRDSTVKSQGSTDRVKQLTPDQNRIIERMRAERRPVMHERVTPEPTQSTASGVELPKELVEVIKALDSAEQKVSFVALKWFRDQFLPNLASVWTGAPGTNQGVLQMGIDWKVFLTNKVHNPKSPAFPTTAIRLNRQSVEVQRILGSSRPSYSRVFRPVEIKGGALSDTILQERG